ncbi:MAG: A/G-specific adenine glycosylase [bacterium]|nr:A/G-specific adenine glycosylase [bacterium]
MIDRVEVAVLGVSINRLLLRWFQREGRDLPWRKNRSPYAVWVSEVMLQQTRVATVVPYFERWLQQYPDVNTLANATEQAVLKAWEGLGYYTRAKNLHRAAQILCEKYDGELPETEHELLKLPGLGKYTAAAVASFAFRQPSLVVDGNVARVLSRWLQIPVSYTEPEAQEIYRKVFATIAQEESKNLPQWNEAIMELGAMVCTPSSPDCKNCPMKKQCGAFRANTVSIFPPPRKKTEVPHFDIAVGILFDEQKILMGLRKRDGLLGGLWELPGGKCELNEFPETAVVREFREETGITVEVVDAVPVVKHGFTHFKITMYPFVLRRVGGVEQAHSAERLEWVTKNQITQMPLPKATKEVLRRIGWDNAAVRDNLFTKEQKT